MRGKIGFLAGHYRSRGINRAPGLGRNVYFIFNSFYINNNEFELFLYFYNAHGWETFIGRGKEAREETGRELDGQGDSYFEEKTLRGDGHRTTDSLKNEESFSQSGCDPCRRLFLSLYEKSERGAGRQKIGAATEETSFFFFQIKYCQCGLKDPRGPSLFVWM